MVTQEMMERIVSRLVAAARPRKIILFGSYARGDATEGSDVDLLVIEPSVVNKWEEMARLRTAIGHAGVGVDVLVYSEAEVEERKDWSSTALYWALKEGKVLYESES